MKAAAPTGRGAAGDRMIARMSASSDGTYDLEHHVCPRCGATLGTDVVVCPRCADPLPAENASVPSGSSEDVGSSGSDASDAGGGEESDDAPAPARDLEPEAMAPVAVARPTDPWLPGALAGLSLVVLLAGVLAGLSGLFATAVPSDQPAADVAWPTRLEAAARLPLSVGLWTACALGALATVAASRDRPLGDWRVAALRLGAAIACARLALFVLLPWSLLTSVVEILLQGAIFVGLVVALFRVKIAFAGILLVVTLVYGVGAAVIGWLMGWALLGRA